MVWRRGAWLATGLATMLGGALSVLPSSAQAVGETAWRPDGSTQERAAASCWEIKQQVPTAIDGAYWLVTPKLVAPQQFYCDMSTDGGGWVLVGRGRDGWTEGGDGQGTTAQVRQNIWEPAGFKPKQLSDETIDGLLNGGAPKDLTDGVRIVRAANNAGTTTSDIRFRYDKMPRWSWALSAGHSGSASIYSPSTSRNTAGRSYQMWSGVTTREINTGNAYTSLSTFSSASNNWVSGLQLGQYATGSASSTDFLYSTAAWGYSATPMTQIWLRPKLTTTAMSYPQVPNSGTERIEQRPLAESRALPGTWGVAGQANGRTDELNTEAHAFAQIGDVMFVGGNFARVEEHADRKATGTASRTIAQSYLAAFDARTGDWIPGFRPVFDNQVNALAALPNGKLAVGGEFTTVNGKPQPGLVALNPVTGATDATWKINVENRITGERVNVQTMDVQGDWLYLGGNFTHLTGGNAKTVYARKAARLNVADAAADKDWNPAFDGKVQAIDASADGTRVYASGYFLKSGSTPTQRVAIISSAPGAAVIPFEPVFSIDSPAYQQAIRDTGSTFWVGGGEHSMFGYDASSLSPMSLNITRRGGDLQTMADIDDEIVYAGCHCGNWAFQGESSFLAINGEILQQWKEAHAINYVGAWDARKGGYLPAFNPTSKARGGYGAWGLEVASDGTLWAGGSYTSVIARDGQNQWAGGFIRFAARPHTAPAAPKDLSVTVKGSIASLTWKASSTSGVTYEILRGGRVVATTDKTSLDVQDSTLTDRFVVRATDGAGNRSASTEVAMHESEPVALIAAGSAWSYLVDPNAAPAATWTAPYFDDRTWRSGAAPLGWGTASIATNIDVPAGQQRPITSYFRRTFDLSNPGAYTNLKLTTRADDGIVVYVNGREVARQNLPAGTVGHQTYATAAPGTAKAVSEPVVVKLDNSVLRLGRNIVSVEVHSNYRSTPNTSMDLTLTAQQN